MKTQVNNRYGKQPSKKVVRSIKGKGKRVPDAEDKITYATISGGAWSDTLPSNLTSERIDTTYTGTFTPPEGDYSHVYTQIDPNGVETSSTAVTIRWAPYTFLTEIDGNRNMRDSIPPISASSVQVKYIKEYKNLGLFIDSK